MTQFTILIRGLKTKVFLVEPPKHGGPGGLPQFTAEYSWGLNGQPCTRLLPFVMDRQYRDLNHMKAAAALMSKSLPRSKEEPYGMYLVFCEKLHRGIVRGTLENMLPRTISEALAEDGVGRDE